MHVVQRARAAGIQLINTATDLPTVDAARLWWVTHRIPYTAGIHPHDIAQASADWPQKLLAAAQHTGVVAIGETGLDFNRNYSPKNVQKEGFKLQIEIACELRKPLFVHDRDSDGAVLQQLNAATGRVSLPPVVVHCFTGTRDALDAYIDAGFFIGITGWITDERRGMPLRQMVEHIPLERLMVETDAPFLKPHNIPPEDLAKPLKSKYKRRNEPVYLDHIIKAIAELRTESLETVRETTAANARTFFGL